MKNINPTVAYTHAIRLGVLSDDAYQPNYAGNYMYMGSTPTEHKFKHIDTRAYITCGYREGL